MLAVVLNRQAEGGQPQNVSKLRSSLAEAGWDVDKAEFAACVDALCADDKLSANRRQSDGQAFEVWT